MGGALSSFENRAVYKNILYCKDIREAISELKAERHIYRILDFIDSNRFHGMVIYFCGITQMFESQNSK